MILMIDNYDSFVFNLARYVIKAGYECHVVRNDAITLDAVQKLQPEKIILSPGPGIPDQAGICLDLIKTFSASIPLLGVCLGHQAIGQAYGGHIERACLPLHGKASAIHHDHSLLFSGLSNPLTAGRYHSLIVSEKNFPSVLRVTARSEQGEIMALAHRRYPVFGVQFHPESILTPEGSVLLRHFLTLNLSSMTHSRLRQISVDQLVRGRYQPRRHFDAQQLEELAESIRATGGLLQPVIVRALSSDQFEIIAGERRWRAAQRAGLSEISCLVGCYTDEQALQASIVENTSRADLNPIEEAEAYQRLIDEFQYLHEEVAAAVGKSRVAITNALRLLRLHENVQQFLVQGLLSEGHGKILAGFEVGKQLALAKECAEKGWSVRRLETAARKILKNEENEGPYSDPNLRKLAVALSDHLGNDVNIDCETRGGGVLRIRFNNVDELEGHFERMGFEYGKE